MSIVDRFFVLSPASTWDSNFRLKLKILFARQAYYFHIVLDDENWHLSVLWYHDRSQCAAEMVNKVITGGMVVNASSRLEYLNYSLIRQWMNSLHPLLSNWNLL
jgi:hypothetical protein